MTIETTTNATSTRVETSLPADAVKKIATETSADLKVVTPAGEVVLDNKALGEIASKAGAEPVKLTVEKVEKADLPEAVQNKVDDKTMVLDLSVETASGKVTDFAGGSAEVTVGIPAGLGKDVKVMYIDNKGVATAVDGKVVTVDGKSMYQFTTGHFSYYALADAATVDKAVKASETDRIKAGVEATTIKTTTTAYKGYTRVNWKKAKGFKVDGYKLYRSTKKTTGTFKLILDTKKTTCKNTKNIKKGTRYYYKVRGYRTVDSVKVYTKWSTLGSRTAK